MSDPRRSGKEFERLVEMIEGLRAGGARVVFDDSITDRQTGSPRQVDVSLYVDSPHGELLVQIECRDTRRRTTVTEVEQLLMKRDAIGAARLVLVSRKGFSNAAVKKAEAGGATLLTLGPSGEARWPGWLAAPSLHVRNLRWTLFPEVRFDLVDPDPVLAERTDERVADEHPTAAEVVAFADGMRMSIFEMAQRWVTEQGGHARLHSLASDKKQRLSLKIDNLAARGTRIVPEVDGREPAVEAVHLIIEFWSEKSEVPFQLYAYENAAGDVTIEPTFVSDAFEVGDDRKRVGLALGPETEGEGRALLLRLGDAD